MIKIQQHLDRPDADNFLDSLALKMWGQLNQRTQAGEFRHNSLKKKLDRLIVESKKDLYIIEVADNNHQTLDRHTAFFKFLLNNDYEKLKHLIIARPEDLMAVKDEILNILVIEDLYHDYNGGFKQTAFGEILLKDLFNYSAFRTSAFCRELMIEAGFGNVTCPYCNDVGINVIDISKEIDEVAILRAYLDLDHFFSKAQNPFFALSFYNLIPSCHSCNSIEKGDKLFLLETHTSPYVQSFNEIYKFSIDPNFFVNNSTDVITLTNITGKEEFNSRDFRLQQRYQGIHLQKVNDLIRQYMNYQTYRNSISFSIDYQEALLQNVPLEAKLILKKPQGKLFRDVMLQIDAFGLLNE